VTHGRELVTLEIEGDLAVDDAASGHGGLGVGGTPSSRGRAACNSRFG
jgi:hypothetical protein